MIDGKTLTTILEEPSVESSSFEEAIKGHPFVFAEAVQYKKLKSASKLENTQMGRE